MKRKLKKENNQNLGNKWRFRFNRRERLNWLSIMKNKKEKKQKKKNNLNKKTNLKVKKNKKIFKRKRNLK